MTNKDQLPKLERVESHYVAPVDPFGRPGRFWSSFFNALLATAVFRCWYHILAFTAWATLIGCLIELKGTSLNISSTLLTVFGTVLGFVISYRTSSSFERYNEGRKLWSSIIIASRTFARAVWFHVPDTAATIPGKTMSPEEIKARTLIEKKTVLNLVEAFAVAVKHYLRGEEGMYYEDLYHLVRFLPAYDLPAGLPSPMPGMRSSVDINRSNADLPLPASALSPTSPTSTSNHGHGGGQGANLARRPTAGSRTTPRSNRFGISPASPTRPGFQSKGEPVVLLPARNPPQTTIMDVFPFSLLGHYLTKKGVEVGGKMAQRQRAKQQGAQNIPLEITLYLSSYIAALQARKVADVPTTNLLLAQLGNLADALTGLERILTTPIPFSYSVHLWTVTVLYVGALPFQVWSTLHWVTIPATALAAFIFFGFLVCGEEIENPFGFDRNDLNLDHFTHNIIRIELDALTALPVPDPAEWAFAPDNDAVFDADAHIPGSVGGNRMTPEQWVKRGVKGIRSVLAGDHLGAGAGGGSGGYGGPNVVVQPPPIELVLPSVKEEKYGSAGRAKGSNLQQQADGGGGD